MRSGPQSFPGGAGISGLAQVEYRLARDAAVRDVKRGRLSRIDVCDAQPELMRVARHLGKPTSTLCPLCDEQSLVTVSFAFGARLPPGGKALGSQAELRALARSRSDVSFYVVEVCTECSWNHLLRSFTADVVNRGGRR